MKNLILSAACRLEHKQIKFWDGRGDLLGALRGTFGRIFGRFLRKYFAHIFLYFLVHSCIITRAFAKLLTRQIAQMEGEYSGRLDLVPNQGPHWLFRDHLRRAVDFLGVFVIAFAA